MSHGRKRPIKVPRPPAPKAPALPLTLVSEAGEGQRQPPPLVEVDEEGFATKEDWSHLQTRYKKRREQFVHEYIKDFNGSQALQRMGYVMTQPWVKASIFLSEPYTQWYLGSMMAKLQEHAIVTKNEVLLGLKKEAHYHGMDGSAAARIAAWRTLAKILGIEVDKVEGTVTLQGGVMLLPHSGTPEEWEKAASAAQEKLKQDVRK
jgi:hypothetical protein